MRFANPDEFQSINLIETIWIAKKTNDTQSSNHCSTYCNGSCVPFSACIKDDEQHRAESYHDKLHNNLHGER